VIGTSPELAPVIRYSRWLVVDDEHIDDVVHVLPDFGREHIENSSCWCGPRWETGEHGIRILIHECDN